MIVDARTALNIHGKYRPYTIRAALWEAISAHLAVPGVSLVITGALDPQGKPVAARSLQIAVAQIVPNDWKVFTERSTTGLTLYRWS